MANIETPMAMDATTDSVKVRLRKSDIGTMGSGTKNSTTTKAMMPTTAMMPSVQLVPEFHSNWLPPIDTQMSRVETPTASRTMPR